ncbi:MAG TPA: hypothetical protein VFR01_08010 [Geobacterales bacterium]|nr:hypothetical protein [Geobacterales bacterium]
MTKRLSAAFVGGLLGALVDSFNIWILGRAGITDQLGISLKPEFTPSWLYPRLVWGGIWALLLVIPFATSRPLLRGALFSLIPSAMVLLVVFPGMGKGMFGLGFGLLTPVLVILLNIIYGMVASLWYRAAAH